MNSQRYIGSTHFGALGDPNRLCIIRRLCEHGPSSTKQITTAVPISRQAATKHLELLESAGLVISKKQGRERIWTLQHHALAKIGEYLVGMAGRWDATLRHQRAEAAGMHDPTGNQTAHPGQRRLPPPYRERTAAQPYVRQRW